MGNGRGTSPIVDEGDAFEHISTDSLDAQTLTKHPPTSCNSTRHAPIHSHNDHLNAPHVSFSYDSNRILFFRSCCEDVYPLKRSNIARFFWFPRVSRSFFLSRMGQPRSTYRYSTLSKRRPNILTDPVLWPDLLWPAHLPLMVRPQSVFFVFDARMARRVLVAGSLCRWTQRTHAWPC